MVNRLLAELSLAELYDEFCVGRQAFGFYLLPVMSAGSVLDMGCSTCGLPHMGREDGYTERLA